MYFQSAAAVGGRISNATPAQSPARCGQFADSVQFKVSGQLFRRIHFDPTSKADNAVLNYKQKIFIMNKALKIILGIICVMLIISSFQVLAEMGTNSGSIIGFILMVGIGIFGLYKLFLSNPKKD
ncbi:MAG: hypothetical protein ABIR78_13140 [Ferruginibacter sp.]